MEGAAMEASILPFLPLLHTTASGDLQWPPELHLALQSVATRSHNVHGGKALCAFINDLRAKSQLPHLSPDVLRGFTEYFDEFFIQVEPQRFFENVLPFLADLALRLPLLLNSHFKYSKGCLQPVHLRVLRQQEPGFVYMSQELVAAILTCAFFCLYPTQSRKEASLPDFKFEGLFERVSTTASQQQHKVHCVLHYFTRLSQAMPQGIISFERKVLLAHAQEGSCSTSGFDEHYWRKSSSPFCSIQVVKDGLIEDQRSNALEVDFANRFLGGGVLRKGCVQEEIRFVISPELIAGMLFMPAMQDNEAIEIRGVERFSHYTGYSSSFRFAGNYSDTKPRDSQGRREMCLVAIDALRHPGQQQYKGEFMLRETNKAFCGFREYLEPNFRGHPSQVLTSVKDVTCVNIQDNVQTGKTKNLHNLAMHRNKHQAVSGGGDATEIITKQLNHVHLTSGAQTDAISTSYSECNMGIATGNWGCGAYGGDVELKSILQWIAASQAGRPFLHYFTFGSPHGQGLEEIAEWIINKGWLVGDVWKLLVKYGQQRLKRTHKEGLFKWMLPRLREGNAINSVVST